MIKGPIIPGYRLPPISPDARARAEERWRDNRELHQQALRASRGECTNPPQQSLAVTAVVDPPMCVADANDDWDLPHPVETAILGKALGNPNLQRRMGIRHLTRHDVAAYVQDKGVHLISSLVFAQDDRTVQYGQRMVVVIKFGDADDRNAAYGIRVVEGGSPLLSGLSDVWCFLTYDRLGLGLDYALRLAEGTGAMDQGLAWLRSQGTTVTDAFELRFLAGTWGTRLQGNRSRITGVDEESLKPIRWSHLEDQLSQDPFVRLHDLVWPNQLRRDEWVFVATYKREEQGDFARNIRALDAYEFGTLSDESANLLLKWHPRFQRFSITRLGGEHAYELGLKWASSQGIRLTAATRALLAGWWGVRFKPEKNEQLLWGELKSELAVPGTVQRWADTRSRLDPSFDADSASLHLVAFRRGAIYAGLQLYTDEEFAKAGTSRAYHVHFVKMANGEWGVRRQPGEKPKSLVEGMTIAPDADAMDEAAQLAAALGRENFGNLDEQACKPEPMTTPAEVMPVPRLERPAEAVDLPKLGGYVTMDPEDLKNLQTPPSDCIPVGVRPRAVPDEETAGVVASVSALAISAIAFFCGGAALLRAPIGNPAYGSGGAFLSPRNRYDDSET